MLGKEAVKLMFAKRLPAVLCGALLAGYLAGCGLSAEVRGPSGPRTAEGSPEVTAVSLAVSSGDSGEEEAGPAGRFRPYEPFGLLYDAEENELRFGGERVRWFEDYYPLSGDGAQAGNDFFDEDGTVDVHAVRDRSRLIRRADGSYDPGGILTGVEAFSEEAFAARDVQALRDPAPATAVAGGGEWSQAELEAIAEGYAPFGITYDAGEDQWYYNGEAACSIRDVLISNGESPTGGRFHGTIRTLSSERGSVRIETVRDFTRPDAQGYGTLTGVNAAGAP